MNLEYEQTIDNLIEFNLFHLSKSPYYQRQLSISRFWGSVLSFILFLFMFYIDTNKLNLCMIVTSVIGGLIIFVFYLPFYRWINTRQARKLLKEGDNKAVLGHHELSLSPEGIFVRTQTSESKTSWSAITKVLQNDQYVFLYVSSINAFVIPKKAFANESTLQEFLDYIDTHSEQKTASS